MNKGKSTQQYTITAKGFGKDLAVIIDDKFKQRALLSGEVLNLPIKIRAAKSDVKRRIQNIELTIKVVGENGATIIEETKYFGPKR